MKTGILLSYYGSAASIDGVAAWYAELIHRAVDDPALQRYVERAEGLGQPSPLHAITARQAAALERRLDGLPVALAGKHGGQGFEAALRSLLDRGVNHAVSLPLHVLWSKLGVNQYHLAVERALRALGATHVSLTRLDRWEHHSAFIEACAVRLRQALDWLPPDAQADCAVVFVTHSQPSREVAETPFGDTYRAWAEAVCTAAGAPGFTLAYRSASNPDKWLGPDISEVIRAAATAGKRALVAVPLATLSDNLEVRHDIDQEARTLAETLGLLWVSAGYLNDADDFMHALELIVRGHLEGNALQVSSAGAGRG